MKTLRVLRVLFAIVAVVAGIAGIVMLVAPADTGDYFSWPIGPPPLTTLIGAFYVASAVVFGLAALRLDWPATRGLCVGVLALTVPTLIATVRHDEVFDFGRVQAVLWVLLFVASPCAYGTVLFLRRGTVTATDGRRLPTWARTIAVLLGAGYLAFAAWCWLDPEGAGERLPFALPALSGAFLGCWALFLATLAVFAARRPAVREARLPVLALTLWPLAGLVAGLRSFDDLASDDRVGYLVTLGILAALGLAVFSTTRE